MSGWMDGWMDGRMDGQIYECIDRYQIDTSIDKWMDGWNSTDSKGSRQYYYY